MTGSFFHRERMKPSWQQRDFTKKNKNFLTPQIHTSCDGSKSLQQGEEISLKAEGFNG